MATKGTYAAYQQLKPTTGFDPAQALIDVGDYEMRQDANRRADEHMAFLKEKYANERNDMFMKAAAGDMSVIGDLATISGYMQPDEAMSDVVFDTRSEMQKMTEEYGVEEIYSNPELFSKWSNLMNTAKYMHKATGAVTGRLNEISAGMKWTRDEKGNMIPPKYNPTIAGEQAEIAMNLVNGKYASGMVGSDRMFSIPDGRGGVALLSLVDTMRGNFGEIPAYVDFDEYLEGWGGNNGRLGSMKVTTDKNGRTIVNDTFDNMRGNVRNAVKQDFGQFGNLSDFAISFLTEKVGMNSSQIGAMTEEDYEQAIDLVVDGISTYYEGETANTVNVPLMNAQTAQSRLAHDKAMDWAELDLKKQKFNESKKVMGKYYSTFVGSTPQGRKYKVYSIPKNKSIMMDAEGNISMNPFGGSDTENQKYDNVLITDDGYVMLSDGNKTERINALGIPSIANQLGFASVEEMFEDANNTMGSQPSTAQSNPDLGQLQGALD